MEKGLDGPFFFWYNPLHQLEITVYYIDKNFETSLIISDAIIAAIFKRHSLDYNKIKNRFSGMSGAFYGVGYAPLIKFLREEGIAFEIFDGYAEEVFVSPKLKQELTCDWGFGKIRSNL